MKKREIRILIFCFSNISVPKPHQSISHKCQDTPVFTPLEAAQVSLRSNAWFLDLFLHDSMSALANLSKNLYSGSRLATTVSGSFCNSFYGPFLFLLSVDHSIDPAS